MLLAGCSDKTLDGMASPTVGSTATDRPDTPPVSAAHGPAPGYAYDCPGEAWPLSPVCGSLLAAPDAVLAEPFLAVQPGNPETIVVTANARSVTAEDLLDVRTFVSTDGGASWRASPRPERPPGRSAADSILGDPVVAFLADGGVLQAAMLCGLDGACSIVVAKSADLAASWTPWAVISSSTDVDREWLAVQEDGSILADWTSGNDVEVVVSHDQGASWQAAGRIPACIGASPIELVAAAPHLACVDYTGDGPEGIRIAAHHNETWSALEDAQGLEMTWPRILSAPSGRVLVLEDYHNSSVAVRWADGPAWGPLVDVRETVSVDDGWTRTFCHWEAIDPWGRLHLLLGGEPSTALAGPPDRVAMAYAHVVLDGGSLVQEQRLTGEPPAQVAQLPLGQVVVSSDYGGLAFAGEEGYIAWPEGGGIVVTHLVPA